MTGRVTPREGPRYNALWSEGDCGVMRGAVLGMRGAMLGVRVMSVMVEGVAIASKYRDRGMGRRDIS